MECNEGRLEIRTDADTCDDLVDDDARPAGFSREINVEAKSKSHKEHAEPDGRQILARLLDNDPNRGRDEGKGQDEGKCVDARKNWGSAENSLKVKREEIGSRDESRTVAETNGESGDVRPILEQPERHHRVDGEFPFVHEEEEDSEKTKDYQAKYGDARPWIGEAAVFESKEKHDGTTDDSNGAQPIDGFEASDQRSLGSFDVKVEHYDDECNSIKRYCGVNLSCLPWKGCWDLRTVDVEAPPP